MAIANWCRRSKVEAVHLFDTIKRTHIGLGKHTEDAYSFLNRSAWPTSENVRNLLESYFLRYPSDEREELKIKFKSQFDSAFFGLLLHELLLRIGAEVSVHPTSTDVCNPEPDQKCAALPWIWRSRNSQLLLGAQRRVACDRYLTP